MQDVAGFAHLDHEGRLPAREIVTGTDAGEDAVDRADHRVHRRHETADMGEQHDQRVLAHVGALAAHVGAGNDEHPPLRFEPQVVRFERLLAHCFNHRMPSAFDPQAGLRHQHGP
jgi:hypothetical protein